MYHLNQQDVQDEHHHENQKSNDTPDTRKEKKWSKQGTKEHEENRMMMEEQKQTQHSTDTNIMRRTCTQRMKMESHRWTRHERKHVCIHMGMSVNSVYDTTMYLLASTQLDQDIYLRSTSKMDRKWNNKHTRYIHTYPNTDETSAKHEWTCMQVTS